MRSRRGRPSRSLADVDDAERERLAAQYWVGETTKDRLIRESGLSRADFDTLIEPRPAPGSCRRCGQSRLTWPSRTSLDQDRRRCSLCRHWSTGTCSCEPCKVDAAERARDAARAEAQRRAAAIDEWEQTYADPDYLSKTLRDLSPTQRAFLEAIRQHLDHGLTWGGIARRAGVDEHHVDRYLNRFITLGLLFDDGDCVYLHPDLRTGGPLLLR